MGSASMTFEEDTQRYDEDPARRIEIISQLQDLLPFLWIAVPDTAGINVLLLSRVEEKSIQRQIHFSWWGEEKISVHGKPIPRPLSDRILHHDKPDNAISPTGRFSLTVQHILTVVERLRSYEVCVGVDDARFKLFWESDKCGDIDKNPFGELRYKETFRPSNCHLLVSTLVYLKRSCPACIETKMRFKKKNGDMRETFLIQPHKIIS